MIHYVVRIIWYSAGGLENNRVGHQKKKKEKGKHCELEDRNTQENMSLEYFYYNINKA